MNAPEPSPTLRSRMVRQGILVAARWSRSMLLGVRGVVVDAENRVFLVRHTYVAGWHLPGGGVEIGESVLRSLERELQEEGNIQLAGNPELHGIFFNPKLGNRDHVAVYVVRNFLQNGARQPDYEIAESGFFARDRLPDTTTASVRARLAEIFDAQPLDPVW